MTPYRVLRKNPDGAGNRHEILFFIYIKRNFVGALCAQLIDFCFFFRARPDAKSSCVGTFLRQIFGALGPALGICQGARSGVWLWPYV